jgi:hypothetical protein
MSRFNTTTQTRLGATTALGTTPNISITQPRTFEGGAGYARDHRSELVLLAVSEMASEQGTFYESGNERAFRLRQLLDAVKDDTEWLVNFLLYVRNEAHLRTVPVKMAADLVHLRLAAGLHGGNRRLVYAALQRADEPGEFLAYWRATHGTGQLPQPVKRGIADAIARLYTQRSAVKQDSTKRGWRFADVIRLVGAKDSALFKYLISSKPEEIPEELGILRARQALLAGGPDAVRAASAGQLNEAGMTWEAYAGALQGPMDAAAWEKIIPSMGYMALLRNLRNFDQAGISRTVAREVEDRLTDPSQVAHSQQLPIRFLSAYRAVQNSGTVTAWGPAIEQALNLSLSSIPVLPGRTLVLVDVSGSMSQYHLSEKSKVKWKDAAAVFGAAIALRAESAGLFAYDHQLYGIDFGKANSVLPLADGIGGLGGGGTDTPGAIVTAVDQAYPNPDRVILVTDEQYNRASRWSSLLQGGIRYSHDETVDAALDHTGAKFAYTWNLVGYQTASHEQGKRGRYVFGGLSDNAFRMINALESHQDQGWPWT